MVEDSTARKVARWRGWRARAVPVLLALVVLLTGGAMATASALSVRHALRDAATAGFRAKAEEVAQGVERRLSSIEALTGSVRDGLGQGPLDGAHLRALTTDAQVFLRHQGAAAIVVVQPVPADAPIPPGADDLGVVPGYGRVATTDAVFAFEELRQVGWPADPAPIHAALTAATRGDVVATSSIAFPGAAAATDSGTSVLAAAIPGTGTAGPRGWVVVTVAGNWVLRDVMSSVGSELRAELREAGTTVALDHFVDATTRRPALPAGAPVAGSLVYGGRQLDVAVVDPEAGPTTAGDREGRLLLLTGWGVSAVGGLLLWALATSRVRALARADAAAAEARDREEHFRTLVQHSADVISVIDGGRVTWVGGALAALLGYHRDEVEGRDVAELVHPDDLPEVRAHLAEQLPVAGTDVVRFECRLRHSDGTWRYTESTASTLHGTRVRGAMLTTRDVTQRRALESQLRHQASHDPLTGLANRALFAERVAHALTRRDPIAVLFCDLDDFKTVNDGLGHAAGDRLLIEMSARLATCVRAGDTVARLGGDEFAILLEGAPDAERTDEVAARVLACFDQPFVLEGEAVRASTSVGIAHGDGDTVTVDQLLRNADAAMYTAKRHGKGRAARDVEAAAEERQEV